MKYITFPMTNLITCPACGIQFMFKEITAEKCISYNTDHIIFICINCNHIIHIHEEAKYIAKEE